MVLHFVNAWLYLRVCPVFDRNWRLSQHTELFRYEPVPAPTAAASTEGGGDEEAAPNETPAGGEPTAATSPAATDNDERKGTLWSSTLILISSVFGSSVLAIPFALAQCGWALGAACLVACALLTQIGAWMLVECARRVMLEAEDKEGQKGPVRVTMTQLAVKATPWIKDLPEVLVVLNCLGSATAALVVIGGIAPTTFADIATLSGDSKIVDDDGPLSDYLRSRGLWIALVFLLVSPLTFLRSLNPLRYTGVFTALSVAYLSISIVLSYATPSLDACSLYGLPSPCPVDATALDSASPGVLPRLLQACPIFFVSLSVNFQILPIHNALRTPTPATTTAAAAGALAFSTGTYLVASIGAYATFGTRIRPNLLMNYGNNALMDAARVLMHVVVGVLYPLVVFPARASIMNLLSSHRHRPNDHTSAAPLFLTTTLGLFAISLGPALLLRNLSKILGVVGAIATVPISLTLPALFLACFTRDKRTQSNRVLHWVGCVFTVLGMAMTVFFLYGTFATP